LPLSEEALGARLQQAHIARNRIDLPRLVNAASLAALDPPPFVGLLQGGTRIAIRRRDIPLASSAFSIAVRTTYNRGVNTIQFVASRLSTVMSVEVAPAFVARIVSAIHGFEWLHPATGWFWLRTRPSRLMGALAKVFSVASALPLSRLDQVLFKGHDPHFRPPAPVVETVGLAFPGAFLDGDTLTIPRRLDRSTYLSRQEQTLVEVMEAKGGALSIQALRKIAELRTLSGGALSRFLRFSPLLELLPEGRCCLVGASI
jgi:hypothetical protein